MRFKCSAKRKPVLLETDDSWGENNANINIFSNYQILNKENIFQSRLTSLIMGSGAVFGLARTLKKAPENNS